MSETPAGSADLAPARSRMQALQAWLAATEGGPVRLVETHISWVLLTATLAYKLKKPLHLPFLDFSTLAARRHCCDEELRLNRRLAPALYLDVVEVCDSPQGPRIGGGGEVIDVAVRMRRFPDGALWSEMLADGRLAPEHIDAMAQRLADFHRDAAVAAPDGGFGSAAAHEHVVQGLIVAIDKVHAAASADPPGGALDGWPVLRAWLAQQLRVLPPRWAARLSQGQVRECHGDLHLANVLQLDGTATAFDGLEFDPSLRWIDVQEDMAFLAMDLLAHGQRALAYRFINAYLEATGDYEGVPTLRFYLVCRALVRAQVGWLRDPRGAPTGAGCTAAGYLQLASDLSTGADARLAVMHGLPGSGKSFMSQALIQDAGAIRVRSDVERKRLFGLGAWQSSRGRVPGGIYAAPATVRTYARLLAVSRTLLVDGWPVVVDAAFLKRSERAQFAALAASLGLPFSIIDCRAPLALLHQRLEHRRRQGEAGVPEASEADAAVLEQLVGADEPLDDAEQAQAIAVDPAAAAPASPEALAQAWRAAVAAGPR